MDLDAENVSQGMNICDFVNQQLAKRIQSNVGGGQDIWNKMFGTVPSVGGGEQNV